MLHLSMHGKVRECINGNFTLEHLFNVGSDIMKDEYFMVAAHDLLETTIIENFASVIPAIGSKSISDFVFNGIPYDLKNTNYLPNFSRIQVNQGKAEFARKLLEGADIQRLRKQAERTINNWGLNRFYVLVEDQERWLIEPEAILNEVVVEARKLDEPLQINIDGLDILVQVIAI